jgi:hypothetical protein
MESLFLPTRRLFNGFPNDNILSFNDRKFSNIKSYGRTRRSLFHPGEVERSSCTS